LLDMETVDQIDIATDTGESLRLKLKGQSWVLDNDLPVAQGKMTELLTSLKSARTGWPIATTPEAAQQLNVADTQFRRKLGFSSKGTELPALLIGSSPSFKNSHVRKQGTTDIHSLEIDEYYLSADAESWIDAYFLRLNEDQITELHLGERIVSKQNGQWTQPSSAAASSSVPSAGTQAPTPFNAAEFVKKLSEIEILGVVKPEDVQKVAGLDAEWAVKTAQGDKGFKLMHNAEDYYLQRDDYPHTFRISKALYDVFLTSKNP
jgi:hypothetical protein